MNRFHAAQSIPPSKPSVAVRAFIQARMSSSRFPGKVLAPLGGKPIIEHVIQKVTQVVPTSMITVATSTQHSDDPLVCYVRELGISVHRGPLDNVFERFRLCLEKYPCDWFFRVCADSPFLDCTTMRLIATYSNRPEEIDLVTNVFPRTYPRGQSIEMIRSARFSSIEMEQLTPGEREHVTKVYYNHPQDFGIANIESGNPELASTSLVVDTLEDLSRLANSLGE